MAPLSETNNPPPLNREKLVRQRQMANGNNEKLFDVKYKVLLLGDTTVGKTSLQRFIAGRDFRPDIGSSIGIDFVSKIIPIEKARVNLQIWDTAGQKHFRTIGKSHYASTKAFVLVYDVTNPESFRLIEQFNQFIEQAGLDMERRYLVANKIDLEDNRRVDEETGKRFAIRNSMIYFETSCKTGENITDLFEQIASDLIRQHNPKKLEFHQPVVNNFAYNYNPPTITKNEIPLQNLPQTKPQKKKRRKFCPSSSYESVDNKKRFNLCRLIFCCNPRKTSSTLD